MTDIKIPDSISREQADEIWDHLVRAKNNEHNYGSDTAEVYLYLALPYNPLVRPLRLEDEPHIETPCDDDWCSTCDLIQYYRKGGAAIHNLCRQFEAMHNVTIHIADGDEPLDDLLNSVYTHRVHLTVKHNT